MVSQKIVQEVMEILNRPCNTRDIANYMITNGLSNIASDIKPDISNCLNSLRKWEVVDKLPDFHGKDSNKWYLLTSQNKHNTKDCVYCKGIKYAHNHNTSQHMVETNSRNIRLVTDRDHMPEEFDLTIRRW